MRPHSCWQLDCERSPIKYATTCRVLRQSAIQIQRLRAFFRTNDQSSSNSSVVASGSSASATIRVCASGGRVISFFEPTGDRVSGDAKGASQPAQTAALVIGAKYCLTLTFRVAVGLWVVAAITPTVMAEVSLFAVIGQPVTSNVGTGTMPT